MRKISIPFATLKTAFNRKIPAQGVCADVTLKMGQFKKKFEPGANDLGPWEDHAGKMPYEPTMGRHVEGMLLHISHPDTCKVCAS